MVLLVHPVPSEYAGCEVRTAIQGSAPCPLCGHSMTLVHPQVSITFDPFLYLPVPLPQKQKVLPIFYFAREPHSKPIKVRSKLLLPDCPRDPGPPSPWTLSTLAPQFLVSVSKENSSASEVLDSLSQSVHVKPENLRLAEVCLSFPRLLGLWTHVYSQHIAVGTCEVFGTCTRTRGCARDCIRTGGMLLVEEWLKPGVWVVQQRCPQFPAVIRVGDPQLFFPLQTRSLSCRTILPLATVLSRSTVPSCYPGSACWPSPKVPSFPPGSVLFLRGVQAGRSFL